MLVINLGWHLAALINPANMYVIKGCINVPDGSSCIPRNSISYKQNPCAETQVVIKPGSVTLELWISVITHPRTKDSLLM